MKRLILSLLGLGFVLPVSASGQDSPASISVAPTDIHLSAARDRQQIIVQAVMPNGLTADVTDQVTWTLENEALVRRDGATFYPVADGSTKLKVAFGAHTVEVPVTVQNCQVDPPISFRQDVMPVFMKTSCNNGSCHGAARGKDGFRISLFGFDPEGDHYRLTREIPGRRINLALPRESLLLEKGAGQVPHTGGKRFEPGSEHYNTVLRWLEAGAPNDPGPVPAVVSVELYPKNAVMDGEGATQRLTVRAKYSDGTDRDVTNLAFFSSNNENSAEIAQTGLVTAHARGEAFIMARFETHTVGSQFIVLPKGLQYEDPKTPENNYIDTLVNAKLRKLRIVPSELCSDEEFLRRVFVDITGTMPTVEEHAKFLADTDPAKRDKLVDDLLDYEGKSDELGKNVGDDLREGKATLPLLIAMARGTPEQRSVVRQAIELGEVDKLAQIVDIVRSSGAIEATREAAMAQAEQARACLALLPDTPARQALAELSIQSVRRSS